jgi:hypothetical protein
MGIQINTQPQVFTSLNSTSISAQNLTAIRGTFTTSVSSPAISAGKFTGDGSGLTGIAGVGAGVTSVNGLTGVVTNVITTSGAAFTGNVTSPSVSATAISAVNLTASRGTFTTSVSSPAISAGKFTGDGSGLTGVVGVAAGVTSVNGLTGVITNAVFSNSATNFTQNVTAPSLSSQTLSSNTLTISGYPITPVTTVYSVANGATSTYTLALSDNNNTITLNLGTSGIVLINNSLSYPVGFQTNIIQLSTGRVTLSATTSSTLKNDFNYYRTYQQYSAATLINLGSVWVCYGSLSS